MIVKLASHLVFHCLSVDPFIGFQLKWSYCDFNSDHLFTLFSLQDFELGDIGEIEKIRVSSGYEGDTEAVWSIQQVGSLLLFFVFSDALAV